MTVHFLFSTTSEHISLPCNTWPATLASQTFPHNKETSSAARYEAGWPEFKPTTAILVVTAASTSPFHMSPRQWNSSTISTLEQLQISTIHTRLTNTTLNFSSTQSKGKMQVVSCKSASGYFASWSASQICEYWGKVRDGRICELPAERMKSAAWINY